MRNPFLADAIDYSSPFSRMVGAIVRILTPERLERRRRARAHKEWCEDRRDWPRFIGEPLAGALENGGRCRD